MIRRFAPPYSAVTHESGTVETWEIAGLKGAMGLSVSCTTGDQLTEALERFAGPDTIVRRTITRTTVDVYEYTVADVLGTDSDVL